MDITDLHLSSTPSRAGRARQVFLPMADSLSDRDSTNDKVQESLAMVFDQYAPLLYRYAIRLCRDQIEADNIIGDVFARLLERLAVGEGPQINLQAYLYQITYHFIADHARERQRTTPLDHLTDIDDQNKNIPSTLEDQDLLDTLASVITHELTDEQRQVIILRYQENFSLRDTAEIIGKNVDTVKALQNHAILKMKNALIGRNYEL